MGKPLVLDVSQLLRKIQDALQAIFKTYPIDTSGTTGIVGHGASASVWGTERSKRERKLQAESWKAASTMNTLRNWIR